MRLRGRPQAAAAAPEGGSLRAGACGLQGVAEEVRAGRRQGRPAGWPRRAKPVGPGEARGACRPMGRLMLKCAEGQGIVTGK